jgi:hypothetical protein
MERSVARKVEVIFNVDLVSTSRIETGKPRVDIALYPNYADEPYRFMYDKVADRARGKEHSYKYK